jgi:hypothetical protein
MRLAGAIEANGARLMRPMRLKRPSLADKANEADGGRPIRLMRPIRAFVGSMGAFVGSMGAADGLIGAVASGSVGAIESSMIAFVCLMRAVVGSIFVGIIGA